MNMSNQPIVIVKKSVHGKHGHHGGAWKVAYADFVTAMMAFFLVMWIVGQDDSIKQSVASYFRDPVAFESGGTGVLPGSPKGAIGGGQNGITADTDQAKKVLQRAADHLQGTLASKFADVKDRIDVLVTNDGLLIELREAPDDGFFATGSAAAKPETVKVLSAIATELMQLPNKVAIEGHTDSRPYASREGYGNWELSVDRANTARRILERSGLRGSQIDAVQGYAATRLRTPDTPFDAGNRRISIVVRLGDSPKKTATAGSIAISQAVNGGAAPAASSSTPQAAGH